MEIEKFSLEKDIKVLCLQATSFPNGVMEAFQKLHAKLPDSMARKSFGISRPEGGGGIVYKAAAEEMHEGEAEELGLESFTIKAGVFYSVTIHNFMNDLPGIGKTFTELLAQPGIDPNGYCLEWYLNDKDVRCMVPMQ